MALSSSLWLLLSVARDLDAASSISALCAMSWAALLLQETHRYRSWGPVSMAFCALCWTVFGQNIERVLEAGAQAQGLALLRWHLQSCGSPGGEALAACGSLGLRVVQLILAQPMLQLNSWFLYHTWSFSSEKEAVSWPLFPTVKFTADSLALIASIIYLVIFFPHFMLSLRYLLPP